jgi:Ni,Fe-hydrogenase III large subunit
VGLLGIREREAGDPYPNQDTSAGETGFTQPGGRASCVREVRKSSNRNVDGTVEQATILRTGPDGLTRVIVRHSWSERESLLFEPEQKIDAIHHDRLA